MQRFNVLCVSTFFVATLLSHNALAGLGTQDLSSGITASDVANTLVGPGVAISNVTYSGANIAAGKFTGGTGIIGFESGIILSSGNIKNVIGPNASDNITTGNGLPGDADLTALSGVTTNDAAVLEFDFVPNADKVFVQYVFSSDEYNEFVNSSFNDSFAFFINGVNCATVENPPVPVSINTINNGNPLNTLPNSHPELYLNNDLNDGGGAINTEMDGLTVVLSCQANVNPNTTNHIKLAIADGSDFSFDSNVFIRAASFTTTPPPNKCALSQGYWKTHANFWPVDNLILGSQTYTKQQLLKILGTPVKGDASLNLAHQLIAAKLNIANGSNPTPVNASITDADNLLIAAGGVLPLGIASSSAQGKAMIKDASELDNYNNNLFTTNCAP